MSKLWGTYLFQVNVNPDAHTLTETLKKICDRDENQTFDRDEEERSNLLCDLRRRRRKKEMTQTFSKPLDIATPVLSVSLGDFLLWEPDVHLYIKEYFLLKTKTLNMMFRGTLVIQVQ